MNKYTVILVSYEKCSIFIVHTEAENVEVKEVVCNLCNKADEETGCGPYQVGAIFKGHLEDVCGGKVFKW